VRARSNGAGKGSEFEVWLPIAEPSSEMKEPDPGPRLSGHAHILIVEDNPDAAEGMKILIELYGCEVVTVPDGLAAIEAARKCDFDGVFIDIGLPGINGYELARRLRAMPGFKPKVMVALTGYGQEDDKRRALSAGFDQHAVKPLKVEALEQLLAQMAQ
jgi:CheY-like chemotaxis protein